MEEEFDLIIEPGRIEKNYWGDLWRYRELFYILSWRDIKVRYKQTVIGFAWSIIKPLLTMIVFTFVFSKIAKLPTDGNTPYAIMVFAGLLPWQFFSNAITESSNSIIGNSNLISKVYFPRIIIPTSSFITSLIDFLISFVILICLMFFYRYTPTWRILMMPLLILLAFIAAYGIGLWLTTMNVKYRDFRYIVPFIVQFGLYISPVGFSSNMVPQKYRILYSLNPMTGVIDAFRWSIMGNSSEFYFPGFLISLTVIIFAFAYSIFHFRKMEKGFADFI